LIALFGARSADALTLVPMCGEHAQTIAAPPVQRDARSTVLRAAPCADANDQLAARTLPDPTAPERAAALDSVPRMPPVWHSLPPLPASGRGLCASVRSGERPGHVQPIERPPCA